MCQQIVKVMIRLRMCWVIGIFAVPCHIFPKYWLRRSERPDQTGLIWSSSPLGSSWTDELVDGPACCQYAFRSFLCRVCTCIMHYTNVEDPDSLANQLVFLYNTSIFQTYQCHIYLHYILRLFYLKKLRPVLLEEVYAGHNILTCEPIHAVWPEYQLSAWWYFASLAIQNALSEDSDQPAQMRGLIWIFTRRTCSKVRLLSFRLICFGFICLICHTLHVHKCQTTHRQL